MNKQNSFIKGTAILIGANAISKLLGAFFKIPLTYILQEEGMAIFNTAMGVYCMVLSFVISGLPLALSRLVAEEYALKNYSNVKKTVYVATVILCILGAFGSLFLYFFADFFALSMKDPKAALAIKIISPSVFFVAWGAVYKSFYQGCVNMIPTAISQVVEATVKLVAGFLGAYLLKNAIIEVTSAGAVSGITVGEIIATFILFILFIPSVKALTNSGEKKRTRTICSSLATIAIPMLICSSISGSINLLDVATIRNSLLKIQFTQAGAEEFLLKYSSYTTVFDNLLESMKLTVNGARWIYGAYSGYALTIFHLPTGIIGALGISVLPIISGAIAKGDHKLVEKTSVLSLKLTLIIALPCALIIYLFNEQLLELLFHNTASARLLRDLSPCLIFVCVMELFTVILHASGHIAEPFFYGLIGIFIKLFANVFLIPIDTININGAVIGSNIGFFAVMLLNGLAVRRHLKIRLNVLRLILKPVLAVMIMGIIIKLLYPSMTFIFKGSIAATVMTLCVGAISYMLALVSLDGLKKEEFNEIHF